MKKLTAFVLTLCLVFPMAACAQPSVPDPVPPEPSTPDPEIQEDSADLWPVPDPVPEVHEDPSNLWVEANGEIIVPYEHFVWSEEWTGNGFLCADGTSVSLDDPDFVEKLPGVSYTDDFEVCLGENVTCSGFTVYDMDHTIILDGSELSTLRELPAGEYIVEISIKIRYNYIESEDQYEASGYDCYFKLTKPS